MQTKEPINGSAQKRPVTIPILNLGAMNNRATVSRSQTQPNKKSLHKKETSSNHSSQHRQAATPRKGQQPHQKNLSSQQQKHSSPSKTDATNRSRSSTDEQRLSRDSSGSLLSPRMLPQNLMTPRGSYRDILVTPRGGSSLPPITAAAAAPKGTPVRSQHRNLPTSPSSSDSALSTAHPTKHGQAARPSSPSQHCNDTTSPKSKHPIVTGGLQAISETSSLSIIDTKNTHKKETRNDTISLKKDSASTSTKLVDREEKRDVPPPSNVTLSSQHIDPSPSLDQHALPDLLSTLGSATHDTVVLAQRASSLQAAIAQSQSAIAARRAEQQRLDAVVHGLVATLHALQAEESNAAKTIDSTRHTALKVMHVTAAALGLPGVVKDVLERELALVDGGINSSGGGSGGGGGGGRGLFLPPVSCKDSKTTTVAAALPLHHQHQQQHCSNNNNNMTLHHNHNYQHHHHPSARSDTSMSRYETPAESVAGMDTTRSLSSSSDTDDQLLITERTHADNLISPADDGSSRAPSSRTTITTTAATTMATPAAPCNVSTASAPKNRVPKLQLNHHVLMDSGRSGHFDNIDVIVASPPAIVSSITDGRSRTSATGEKGTETSRRETSSVPPVALARLAAIKSKLERAEALLSARSPVEA